MEERAPALWWASVLCFLVAAGTGALLRFGFWIGLPWGLEAGNVRHAHSHLMYFSWATPAIIALLAATRSERRGHLPLGAEVPAWAALLLGAASYPAFLVAGYGSAPLFGATLPLASILSGLSILSWYAFVVWYLIQRPSAPRKRSRLLWDAALFGLVLSSLGAWGRAGLQLSGAAAPVLEELSVLFFLGVFSEGWLLLALLGLAFSSVDDEATSGWTHILLWIGLPWASLLGTRVFADSPALENAMRMGGLLFVAGLAIQAGQLAHRIRRHRRDDWLPFLLFLFVHLAMAAGLLVPAAADWGERLGLRVLYLHVLALGAVTSGLFTAAQDRWGRGASPSPWIFGMAALVLLAGLIFLASPWPSNMSEATRRAAAAWTSMAPLLPPAKIVMATLCSRAKMAWGRPGKIEM